MDKMVKLLLQYAGIMALAALVYYGGATIQQLAGVMILVTAGAVAMKVGSSNSLVMKGKKLNLDVLKINGMLAILAFVLLKVGMLQPLISVDFVFGDYLWGIPTTILGLYVVELVAVETVGRLLGGLKKIG